MVRKHPRADALYLEVIADMRRRIASGAWAPGERIPTIDELEQLYPYSRMTIVRAARELKVAGELVARGKGGTIVAPRAGVRSVGVLFRLNFANPAHAEFTFRVGQLVREALETRGMRAVLFEEAAYPYPGDAPCAGLMQAMRERSIQGLVAVQSNCARWSEKTGARIELPFVDVGLYPGRHRVFVDFMAAIDEGLRRCAARGRRRMGLIGNLPPQQRRMNDSAAAGGYQTCAAWQRVDHRETAEAFGFAAMHAIWDNATRPDAIYISDDVIAKGAAQAAAALGIRVPDELLLVCMGNRGIERFYPCPVERVEMDLGMLADAAVTLLSDVMEGQAPEQVLVEIPPVAKVNVPMEQIS